jgi:hypothetical protein
MKNPKTQNSLNENTNLLLSNVSNYKQNIDVSVEEILQTVVNTIIEYMRFISEKITMKNKIYYTFIFERGVKTLLHIFSLIFYYTKNLEISIYHMKKAYYFYIEFIEQISDNNITFLQLSSRDAILFVYKKTIFELNNDYIKNIKELSKDEKNILITIDSYLTIYKTIIIFLINHNDFIYEKKIDYINECCDYIEYISVTLNKNKIKKNEIECIYLFTNILSEKDIKIMDFFKILDEFIKKINVKKKIDDNKIKNKLYDEEISILIEKNNLNKIVDFIFTE